MRRALLALLLLLPAASAQTAAPLFLLDVPATERWVEPQEAATFEATLVSRSREPLRIVFDVARADGGLQAVTPPPVTLGREGAADGRVSLAFVVQSPYRTGQVDETGTVTFVATPLDPEEERVVGEAQRVDLTVRTVGTYVPGPQLFGAMLALGLAALALRRRRG